MAPFRLIAALLLAAAAATATAQDAERGSTPPGQSRDGSAPSDGALKAGPLLPGETGGVPDGAKAQARCEELTGSLREECLKQAREAAPGGSGATTGRPGGEIQPSPPLTTPPQNPTR
jgi:hypothetical protein